jgi:hypothetical protein
MIADENKFEKLTYILYNINLILTQSIDHINYDD